MYDNDNFHVTWNVLLHYLGKVVGSKMLYLFVSIYQSEAVLRGGQGGHPL